jgi:DNA-binding transcriptional ArsR family regulator
VPLIMRVQSADLLQCRFAVSPLTETTDALRSIARFGGEGYNLAWQRQARPRLPGLHIEPLLAILSWPGYQPDFLAPAPDSPFTEVETELDRVRSTTPTRVATELSTIRHVHPALAGNPEEVRDLLADMLARAWSALVQPWWPRVRDVLDADITYRARRLADAGVAATLNELDPRVSWHDDALRFAHSDTREIDLSGGELVLIPSVFTWPHSAISYDPPAVIYPARGIGDIWQPAPRSGEDLVRLIGRARAVLLTALAEPASTTGLAARTRIPVSSVSEHLAILRAAGLVSTTRTGRYLMHQRTALGIALTR